MPVYHFTFHAYGSWMPDRPEGYFKHGNSWQPPSSQSAKRYRDKMQKPAIEFDQDQQQAMLDELIKTQEFQQIELYAAAIDISHVHAVVAWKDDRDPTRIRSQLKSSMTRALNSNIGKRQWFVAKAGQNPVSDEEHLSRLVHEYLPKHALYWYYKSANEQ